MIRRAVEKQIEAYLSGDNHSIFFLWGPRRSGKTTILQQVSARHGVPIFNFDILSEREVFVPTREALEKIASTHKIILIDEVQNFPESTVDLKILHDEFKVKIIATGSSELRQKSKDFDTLAGRFTEHYCLPLSIYEISDNVGRLAYENHSFTRKLHHQAQIFGLYPEVYADATRSEGETIDLLQNILDTYVLKDVITIYDLKNAKLAKDILTKIALQIGSEVSLREIAGSLGANVSTVSNYIEIFIKNYILIALPSFKTNARKAVSANRKLYFYDLGIRNILVKDFRELHLRPDRGGVFENFILSEMEKQRKNTDAKLTMYFYREYGGQEIDVVVEDYKKKYQTAEIKVSGKGASKSIFPLVHTRTTITGENYFDQISGVIE